MNRTEKREKTRNWYKQINKMSLGQFEIFLESLVQQHVDEAEELIDMLRETLPDDLPVVFISSVTGMNIDQLKDVLWTELNSESNKLQDITSEESLVHRDKDVDSLPVELREEGEDEDIEYVDIEDIDDVDSEEDWEEDDEKNSQA